MASVKVSGVRVGLLVVSKWSKQGRNDASTMEPVILIVVKGADHIPNLGEGSPTVGWSPSGQRWSKGERPGPSRSCMTPSSCHQTYE